MKSLWQYLIVYDSRLPPFSISFTELKTFLLLQAHFGQALESELSGIKFKFGDPIPDNIKDWFEDEEDIFKCIKAGSHTNNLGGLLKAKGTTITQFYRKMITNLYTLRLGSEEAMNNYHLHKSEHELKVELENKAKEEQNRIQQEAANMEEDAGDNEPLLGQQEEEMRRQENARIQGEEIRRQKDNRRQEARRQEDRRQEDTMRQEARRHDEARRLEDTSVVEKEPSRGEETKRLEDIRRQEERRHEEANKLEEARRKEKARSIAEMKEDVKKHVTPGVLHSIFKHGKTLTDTCVVQIIKKNIEDGKLKSLTLGDGELASNNVYPVDEESAEMIKEIPRYELVEVKAATINKEKLYLNHIIHFEMFDSNGKTVNFEEPIETPNLKMISKETEEQFARNFPNNTKVEFNSQANKPKTNKNEQLTGIKRKVVDQLESHSQPPKASPRVKRKLLSCLGVSEHSWMEKCSRNT